MASSKLRSIFTTKYTFKGTPDSNGFIVSTLPLNGYVPVGFVANTFPRDGWVYNFAKYSQVSSTHWLVKVNSDSSSGPSGEYSGTIVALVLSGGGKNYKLPSCYLAQVAA